MSFNQDDLDQIDAAIAGGVLSVRYADGRMVTYQSSADLLRARALIVGALQSASATAAPRAVYPEFSRGTDP